MKNPVLYVVIPCYNEQAVLPETNRRLTDKLNDLISSGKCSEKSRVLYVDDGSSDNTWQLISRFHSENRLISGLKLAHNRGHQNALLAGLMTSMDYCDCAASMDADLQDDIDVLDKFLQKFCREDCDIVYGVRSNRESDSFLKRFTAEGYYRFLNSLGVEVIFNHADCRLMSRRALEELSKYKEVNLFLRGMIPHMGFKHDAVYYERSARLAGQSKYSVKKMLGLALDGVTSFSVKPLRLITRFGIFLTVLSVISLITFLVLYFCNIPFAGWLFLLCGMGILTGIQTICIGVVGLYIGKIYAETKGRPRFGIDVFLND